VRVLLIKTSSLGDVIHAFPAVVDAARQIPNLQLTWLVEENFADLVRMHPHVQNVIVVAMRRWRKNIIKSYQDGELSDFLKQLRLQHYDVIIDAQGLIKSAVLGKIARGKLVGFDKTSVRERIAASFYRQSYAVDVNQHAVQRIRSLWAQILGYQLSDCVDYGLSCYQQSQQDYVVLLHGTTWISKHWPEEYWRTVLSFCADAKLRVKIPWGNQEEHERALRIADGFTNAEVLPQLSLSAVVDVLAKARICIAVDSGLGHLACALDVPCISLYGPTNPQLVGTFAGRNGQHKQLHLCADSPLFGGRDKQQICLDKLSPDSVIKHLAGCIYHH